VLCHSAQARQKAATSIRIRASASVHVCSACRDCTFVVVSATRGVTLVLHSLTKCHATCFLSSSAAVLPCRRQRAPSPLVPGASSFAHLSHRRFHVASHCDASIRTGMLCRHEGRQRVHLFVAALRLLLCVIYTSTVAYCLLGPASEHA
jgi:hypothetical protein